jgi:hypothetical protein
MKRTFTILSLAIILLSSCKNIQKMVDKGQYDEAIVYAAEQLQGEEHKKTRYVTALEDAFAKVMARDYDRLAYMKSSDRPEYYGKIYQLYKKIERRQERIRPFLPLISEDGYVAHFKMTDVRPALQEFAEKDAAHHYDLAVRYLNEYTADNKVKARSAYRSLLEVQQYFSIYKDMESLMEEAEILGTEHVYITTLLDPYAMLDPLSRNAFDNIDIRGLDKRWIAFHNVIHGDLTYDYKVSLEMKEVLVDGEQERAHTYHYTREIQDGWNYLLDERGNVAKDTLGNDIKMPKYVEVRARITEVERQKQARLVADLVVIDLHSGREIDRYPIDANIDFHGFSCRLRGDKRALEGADRKHHMDGYLEDFPLDQEMIHSGVLEITKAAKKKIKKQFS